MHRASALNKGSEFAAALQSSRRSGILARDGAARTRDLDVGHSMSAATSLEFTDDVALVGVDGGASSVKAWAVQRSDHDDGWIADGPMRRFEHHCPGFAPVALELQREELAAPIVGGGERRAADVWIANTRRAIVEIARELGRSRLAVAMAMPGLKTEDARGILVSRNGPRCADFVARIEQELAKADLELVAPIPALLSDGYAAALGERFAARGSFRGLEHAYYLGAGTGLSEALMIDGRVRSMDDVAGWFPKAWAMTSARGASYEDELSASAIQRRFAERAGLSPPFACEDFVEERWRRGDPIARQVLIEAGSSLAELLFVERVAALGRSPWGKLHLQRIVLGQRFARLARDRSPLLEIPRDSVAWRFLAASFVPPEERRRDQHSAWYDFTRFDVAISSLDAAVAIGAIAKLCGAEDAA